MKKRTLLCFLLVLSLLLTGCAGYFERIAGLLERRVAFSDMVYTCPDMTELETVLDKCLTAAPEETNIDRLMEPVEDYFRLYSSFMTNFYLAHIHYHIDLSDLYWSEEYEFCSENSAAVSGGMDQLLYALADSPLRAALEGEEYFGEGYFDAYEGESIWDEEFTALMEQESQLQNEYYRLTEESAQVEYYSDAYFDQYGTQLAELFVELVGLRQRIALQAGCGSYPEFAYDFYYGRDYTPKESQAYLQRIQSTLVPLYRLLRTAGSWGQDVACSTEQDTFRHVKSAAQAMGGQIQEAFTRLEQGKLYHISHGENKYNGSFEVFLPDYYQPFVFVSPTGTVQDHLTFAHEFGHFCNDYASYGSMVGVDGAEVLSQGMEYLSLCYGEDTEALTRLKMADALCVYVEQAAYASFEAQVYQLQGQALTVDAVQALYQQVGEDYGFDTWGWDSRDYVAVNHFYTNPMYIISYVVSNDAALQLYQMEQAKPGSGLTCYTNQLTSEQPGFLAFVEEAGLESPFRAGRLEAVAETLKSTLKLG